MPVVGIVCDREEEADGMALQQMGEEYIRAIRDGAGALALLIPTGSPADAVLRHVDGLLFPGALSNVAPDLYGGPQPRPGNKGDAARDATSLPLLRAAIAAGKPLLCICRGFQELNVAMGGTLHQHVQEVPGHLDHREDARVSRARQYGPAHDVTIAAGGLLAGLVGEERAAVNSLHSQGIDRLAPPLRAEAQARDGLVEAVSLHQPKGFALGVQWHPEWEWAENPLSRAIFNAFGKSLVL